MAGCLPDGWLPVGTVPPGGVPMRWAVSPEPATMRPATSEPTAGPEGLLGRREQGDATVDDRIRQALEQGRTIDITTIGRRSGEPKRKEIWFHNLGGRIYITGTPGRRDWYANLLAHPDFTFHLTQGVISDLPARATPITDVDERRAVLGQILRKLGRPEQDLATWVERSPLVEVSFPNG